MGMLLDAESLVLLLEHHADVHVKCRSVCRKFCVISVLDITACPFSIIRRHVGGSVFRIEVLDAEETSAEVNLSLKVSVAVNHLKSLNTGKTRNLCVVGTECRRDMNDTCTVFRSHIITRDDLERALARIEPRNELLVTDSCELRSLECAVKHLERNKLVSGLVVLEGNRSGLRIEERVHKGLSHDIECRLSGIRIE